MAPGNTARSHPQTRRPENLEGLPGTNWWWHRAVAAAEAEKWAGIIEASQVISWSVHPAPKSRLFLDIYFADRASAQSWRQNHGGHLKRQEEAEWLKQKPAPPLILGRKLVIEHDPASSARTDFLGSASPKLIIPQGLAFGSGEHATTLMMLRHLAQKKELASKRILDLGTGSGILALAARKLGSLDVTGLDNDPVSLRTAKENESLNFPSSAILWRRGDVLRLDPSLRAFDLVLANLFSGLLIRAAGALASTLKPGGELWMSGILLDQVSSVSQAFASQGLWLQVSRKRGKWAFLQWRRLA